MFEYPASSSSRAPRWFAATAALFSSISGVSGLNQLHCQRKDEFLPLHDFIAKHQEHVTLRYEDFAIFRPSGVHNAIRRYQIRNLVTSWMTVVENMRTLICYVLCPEACGMDAEGKIRFGNTAGEEIPKAWASYGDQMVTMARLSKMGVEDSIEVQDGELNRLFKEVRAFAHMANELTENILDGSDNDTMKFEAMVTKMLPALYNGVIYKIMSESAYQGEYNATYTILNGVDPDREASSFLKHLADDGKLYVPSELLSTLHENLPRLAVGPMMAGDVCSYTSPWKTDTPRSIARFEHQSGGAGNKGWQKPTWRKLLQKVAVEHGGPGLSYVSAGLRPHQDSGFDNFTCSQRTVAYQESNHDPLQCLQDEGWGAYMYYTTLEKPHKATFRLIMPARSSSLLNIRPESASIEPDERYESLPEATKFLNQIWRDTEEFTPDVFSIHPSIENARVMNAFFHKGAANPRMLLVPVNPLIPPPFKVRKFIINVLFFQRIIIHIIKSQSAFYVSWRHPKYRPRGLMDKASVFGTEDCRFESCRGHFILILLKVGINLFCVKCLGLPILCRVVGNALVGDDTSRGQRGRQRILHGRQLLDGPM